MALHAFVAMPFGKKNGIDFNCVFKDYIKPALEAAGLDVIRADEETRAGDIRKDMFQELLMADLVVADLTIDNPNVWYELGVRHALRKRGVILVCGGETTKAFDIYTDRKERYSLNGGLPDPATLESDRVNLTKMVKQTVESWHGRAISPVYQLIPNLKEPDWKSLRVGDVLEFWEQHEAWGSRIDQARKASRIGDVLVLAEEAPVYAFQAEAWLKAGQSLRKAERFRFALEHLDKGLKIEPDNLRALREKGICLERLALMGEPGYSLDGARDHYGKVLKSYPNDPETCGLLGRVDKDAWIANWRRKDKTPEQMRKDATDEDAFLRTAIESYATGYRANPGHYFSGINALTLMHLNRHLTKDTRYDAEMEAMAGAVRFAAKCERDPREEFYARATLGDLAVLVDTPAAVTAAYKEALVKNDTDWFALNSTRSQLQLLKDLGFRTEAADAGIDVFDRALQKLEKPEQRWQPRYVFLFSGHMIDAPGRRPERFPESKEKSAAEQLSEKLDKMGAGPEDIAFTQGSCGGDILFTEACQKRGVKVYWLQPLPEPEFLQHSVLVCGEGWRDRYFNAKAKLAGPVRHAPEELGAPPRNAGAGYVYTRCNLWLLYTALACGMTKVRFICIWNGGGGDGPGGTEHMFNEVNRRTGQVTWIDTRKLEKDEKVVAPKKRKGKA